MKKLMIAAALFTACGIAFAAGSRTSWREAPTFIRKVGHETNLHRIIDQETGAICYIAKVQWQDSAASISCVMPPSAPATTRPRWQRQTDNGREWLAQH